MNNDENVIDERNLSNEDTYTIVSEEQITKKKYLTRKSERT